MKSVKRALSAMLVLAIMSTMLSLPVKADGIVNVSSAEPTVIGNSSFVWNEKDMKENTNGNDGTISMVTWGSNIRNGTVTINVEKAGTYSIDVNAVINLTLDGASPMSFKIDKEEMKTINKEQSF